MIAVRAAHDRHTRPVSKEDGDIASTIGHIEARTVDLRTHHEHVVHHARLDELVRNGQAVDKACALISDVERCDPRDAQALL